MDNETKQKITDAMKPLAELAGVQADSVTGSEVESVCNHPIWKRGLLPGAKYIKTCFVCGAMETIDFSEWITISDR